MMRSGVWRVVVSGLLWALVLSGCGASVSPSSSVRPASYQTVREAEVVHSLQRQLRERDQRIQKLESQLEALKVIDQEFEKSRTGSRPPLTLRPRD